MREEKNNKCTATTTRAMWCRSCQWFLVRYVYSYWGISCLCRLKAETQTHVWGYDFCCVSFTHYSFFVLAFVCMFPMLMCVYEAKNRKKEKNTKPVLVDFASFACVCVLCALYFSLIFFHSSPIAEYKSFNFNLVLAETWCWKDVLSQCCASKIVKYILCLECMHQLNSLWIFFHRKLVGFVYDNKSHNIWRLSLFYSLKILKRQLNNSFCLLEHWKNVNWGELKKSIRVNIHLIFI